MTSDLRADLVCLTRAGHDRVVEWRRSIHAWPELSYQEHRTADLVTRVLTEAGIETRTGIAGTGVVGLLRGRGPGKTIAVRADMDALPVLEATGLPFASQKEGVAHACGHDSHVAMALGTAVALAALRDRFDGNVMFLFEPNEETLDSGEEAGAVRFVQAGILDDPHVDAVFGQHVYPEYPTGQVALRANVMMTGFDYVDITIVGQTAHTSTSHKGADALVAAAHVVTALQTLASRELDPMESAIVHLGTISGGTRRNILADRVELTGTVRISDQSQRAGLRERIERVVAGVTSALRCTYELRYEQVAAAVVNDPGLTSLVASVAADLHGSGGAYWMPMPRPTAESFQVYGAGGRPYVFWFLGVGNQERGWEWASHHPHFTLDEDAMLSGVEVMAGTCLRALGAW
ncbi:MAG: amidohydrolase [Chloroflexi bacterium]|nr:amidohydrolase [Chloroflexota bacterium]